MNTAYQEGHRNGRMDARCGVKSDYAWHSYSTATEYSRNYSRGYRDGWNEVGTPALSGAGGAMRS